MTQHKDTSVPTVSPWQVEAIRLTGFPLPLSEIDPSGWWVNVVGEPPETESSRPKVGLYKREGSFDGKRLALDVQLGRVDWTLGPLAETSGMPPETLPVIGPFDSALSAFVPLMHNWLGLAVPMTRLAFGAVLAQPVSDRKAGYLKIAAYLPSIRLDPETSSDFFYQINRPRDSKSGISGLRINRLTKWSVLLFQTLGVSLEKTQMRTTGYGVTETACRLELDINTLPEFSQPLPQGKLAEIFDELVDMGREIAVKGDVA
jgi:hypothetical protein